MGSPPFPPPGSLQFELVKTFVDLNVRAARGRTSSRDATSRPTISNPARQHQGAC
jgi:hypothetical protein